jgi:hypothetical protein
VRNMHLAKIFGLVCALSALLILQACKGELGGKNGDGGGVKPDAQACTSGNDKDGDNFGVGCPAGDDCDDSDPHVNPNAIEVCDKKDNNCDGKIDEGVTLNPCGNCEPGCEGTHKPKGKDRFPLDKTKDSDLIDSTGVKHDEKGNLVLGSSQVNFHYMWIANTYDTQGTTICSKTASKFCRGTISKVDTKSMKEVGRYFTFTCSSQPGATSCVDVNGKPINKDHNHTPSRTAVDFNMDAWVANRNVHGGQPSATKIAADPLDCIDRNKNGKIDTSGDSNGDGKITMDCNGDGAYDDTKTVCSGAYVGKAPEFLGLDDECVLFTTNYAESNDIGRSICLDSGKSTIGASNAWVGTFSRPENGRGANRFHKINGYTGKIEQTVDIAAKHHTYGCMADAHHVVWSTDILGGLTYFQSISPYSVGPNMMAGPPTGAKWIPKAGKKYHQYGISINADQHVWLGGYNCDWVLRYKPDRTNFASLSKGTWTQVKVPAGFITRGIAADNRGKVWVGIQDGGYILRINQNVPDGIVDLSKTKDYWKVAATTVIGAGVDFEGHIWAVGHKNHIASRLDVDSAGNVKAPATGMTKNVAIGMNPYTYSDFTGFGLANFVRPQGRWSYLHHPCPKGVKAQYKSVSWKADESPPTTQVLVRVRSGDSLTTMGSWSQTFTKSPGEFGPKSAAPIVPNPAIYLHVEFTLMTKAKDKTPKLKDYGVSYICANNPG